MANFDDSAGEQLLQKERPQRRINPRLIPAATPTPEPTYPNLNPVPKQAEYGDGPSATLDQLGAGADYKGNE